MIDLKPACSQLIDLLAAVSDDQLTYSTPCTAYTVRDLIKHVDEVSQGFAALARKDDGQAPADINAPAEHGADGWRAGVRQHVRELGEAWTDPAAWHGSTDAAGVELSNELWGRIALTEVVLHGWDLARSIGHSIDLPEDTLQACFDHVAEFVPNAPIPELWGPSVEVPADAALLDKIAAITGRTP